MSCSVLTITQIIASWGRDGLNTQGGDYDLRSVTVLFSCSGDNGDCLDCSAGWLPLEILKSVHRKK